MKRKATVEVNITVEVEYDPNHFTEEWMDEFRSYMYDFDDKDAHLCHLAQLYVRGLCGSGDHNWPEGYGPLKDIGIQMHYDNVDIDTFITFDEALNDD